MQFVSRKYSNLRVVLDPKAYRAVEGRRVTTGLNGDFPQGKAAQFENGIYSTDDPKEIALLRGHMNYGTHFYSTEPGEAIEPTDEAIRHENEKRTITEEIASKCPECGKQFKNTFALNGHMKTHEGE